MAAPKKGSNPKPPKKKSNRVFRKKAGKQAAVSHGVNLHADSPKIREMERQNFRRRGFKIAAALIILACLGGLLRITVREAFLKNPQFALQGVAVKTQGPLTVQKIVRATGLTEGENLLMINLRELRTRIERLPPVRSVVIERNNSAGHLSIEVEQRQPVAWLECAKLGLLPAKSGSGHLLDAEGVVFPCEVMTEEMLALPVIRYEVLGQALPGVPLADIQIKSALKLLPELLRRFEQDAVEVRLLDITTPYSIVASFADKTQVTFGVDGLEAQLARFDRVRHEARLRSWDIASLNLLAEKSVPITFRRPPDLDGLLEAGPSTTPASSTITRTTR